MDYKNMFNHSKFNQAVTFKAICILLLLTTSVFAQNKVSGVVTSEVNKALNKVKVYNLQGRLLAETNSNGAYQFITDKQQLNLMFYVDNYQLKEVQVTIDKDVVLNVQMNSFSEELSEIEIKVQRKKVFELQRLKDVEETAIYAGKKTEVVLVNQSTAALASNNARQIYSQVAGLNIFQNDDAGLQLNIGGRGLDPNRTSNFNTRQNGYDISADVLGYPESYYTPPAEALNEIQIIRGAASLQYGTQFGGLVNFVMKKPNPNKPLEIITRNTLGSNNLFTNFTSVGGTKGKVSYYGYYNYKQGDGFRPNSEFASKNAFAHLGYQLSDKTKLEAEITYLNYLAQQAGGLTDTMFLEDPFQSNRSRNWFEVNWWLYNFKILHDFSEKTKLSISLSGLDASRKAIGYRGNYKDSQSNPVSDLDVQDPRTGEYEIRDLVVGKFKNWSLEARLLSEYSLFNRENIFLIGAKYYKANNTSRQGAGTRGIDADFNFVTTDDYISSSFTLPNENIAVFGENIFKFSDKFSVTPGFRVEYINTQSDGVYTIVNYDSAGNPLPNNNNEFEDNRIKERSFVLLGLGASYKPNGNAEFYANVSQNYRSVTFSDIRTVSPTFLVDENIKDSKGFTADFGIRGQYKKYLSYDVSTFGLFYNNRIGIVLESNGPNKGDRLRTNIGDAFIYGVESLIDFNMLNILNIENNNYSFNMFSNLSLIDSEYTKSKKSGVEGNKVEFIPNINFKTGIRFGYKNLLSSLQYSYLSKQYTDATNSAADIPSYDIVDFSLSYKYKIFKLETGVNNLLDEKYFTRRATGYPGPGIIPSAPRNWYVTLQFKF
ncbi:TonB-dependent receptor family protein [Tenacibaculum sp.]|uniref:TonB-dependent receptor family protein n=1 Tax=Tenacibaculum sp. TaxID=1906242 RepID=UPI003D0D8C70